MNAKQRECSQSLSRLFTLGNTPARSEYICIGSVVFMLIVLAWWLTARMELVSEVFLPGLDKVWTRMVELSADGTLCADLKISLWRVMSAFVIASIMSIAIGLLAGSFGIWKASVEPLVDFIRYMPVVALVLLTILWVGLGDLQKILIIWIGTFFQQVLMVMDVVKKIPPQFICLGRTLGMPDRRILLGIVLPYVLPGIWDALRISLGWAWTWLVLAELVAATSGLGYRISISQTYFQTDTIIGYILLLGLLADQLMRFGERLLFKRSKAHA